MTRTLTPARARAVGRTNLTQAPWGVLDQAVSAGTNLGLSLAVARSVSAREFGAFSLVYILYTVLLGLVRTTGTDVLAIQHAGSPTRLRQVAADATGYALTVGALAGSACLLLALTGLWHERALLLVLGLGFPLLLLQDAWRGVLLAQTKPRGALANDLVWAVVQFGLLGLCWALAGPLPIWGFLAVWAAGAAAGAVFGLVQTRIVPRPRLPHRWVRGNRQLALPLLLTELLVQLPAQVTYLLVPLFADLGQLGVLRATYLLFGPIGLVCQSIGALALPDAVRVADRERARRLAVRVSVALAVVATGWSVVVLALPSAAGHAVIGASWTSSPWVRVFLALSLVAEAVLVGARVALATWLLPRMLLRGRLVSAPVIVIGGLALVSRYGAAGLAAALAAGYTITAAVSWREVARARHDQPAPAEVG